MEIETYSQTEIMNAYIFFFFPKIIIRLIVIPFTFKNIFYGN